MKTSKQHHVRDYGAYPGASGTVNRTAIQLAINAALAGVGGSTTVVFDSGTYDIDQAITIPLNNSTISIVGQGSSGSKATTINVAASQNGLEFTSSAVFGGGGVPNNLSGIVVRDIGFTTSTGVTALKFGTSGYYIDSYGKHVIENVVTTGFSLACDILNTRHLSMKDVAFRNVDLTNAQSMRIRAEAGSFSGDFEFNNCEFSTKQDTSTTSIPVLIENATTTGVIAGIKFTDCNVYYGGFAGIYIHNTSASTGYIADIFFNQCQFDFPSAVSSSVGIYLHNDGAAGTIKNIQIVANYFTSYYVAIAAFNSDTGSMFSLNVSNNYINNAVSSGVSFSNIKNFVINGNTFYHCGNSGVTEDYVVLVNSNSSNLSRTFTITNNTHIASGSTSNVKYFAGVTAYNNDFVIANNVCHVVAGGSIVGDGSGGSANKSIVNNLVFN